MQRKPSPKTNNFQVASQRDEEAKRFWEQYPDMRPTPEDCFFYGEEEGGDQISSEDEGDSGGGELPPDLYIRWIAWEGRSYDAWAAVYKDAGLNSHEAFVTRWREMKMSYSTIAQILGTSEVYVRKQVTMAKKKRKAMLERKARKNMGKETKEG